MRIGDLAKATKCDIETIRYYEKEGLLQEPPRTGNGYRDYQEEHVERLQFIRHCRSLQMSLSQIGVLLQLKQQPSAGCKQVDAMLEQQIARIQMQLETLTSLKAQLVALRHSCQAPQSIEKCGILQSLENDGM